MSISSTIVPTLAPTILPVGQFVANDNTAHTLISYTDWKLYIAIGLFITLCVSIICLIKCCKKYDKISETDIHKAIQNNKSILNISSVPQSNMHIVLDKEPKQKYTNSKAIEDEKNINIHLVTNPNRKSKIILEPNDDSSDDSITSFEPMTRYSNTDAKQKRLKKYKMKEEKTDNINMEINTIQMENEKQICVNAVNLSFDHDLNPILYTGMSVINPMSVIKPENLKFSNDINGKIIGINEGREHSITESSTFTMKSHHVIGINEDNIDFKMFTKGVTDIPNQHAKLMEIQSECENLMVVNDVEDEQKNKAESKYNRLTVSTDETNCSNIRLPKNVTAQGFL